LNNLKNLEKKIDQYKNRYSKSDLKQKTSDNASVFVMSELVAALVVGGFLGYYLDQYFNTKVLFLLIFVILGLISAFYNIYKKYK
jgi:F0F1-type ATP synthase assembly protein I